MKSVGLCVSLLVVCTSSAPHVALGQCTLDWLPGQGWPGVWGALGGSVNATTVWDADGPGGEPPLLVVGGRFYQAGGASANNVAAWDGARWYPLGSGTDYGVHALTVYKGALIAGGWFTMAGGTTASYIARWDGVNWNPLGTGLTGVDQLPGVRALTVYNGELIVGGRFTTAGGTSARNIARWDGLEWRPLGPGMDGTGNYGGVLSLTVHNNVLVAGGSFTTAGGVSVNNIARWDGTSWHPLGSGSPYEVLALTVFDGDLIASPAWVLPSRWDGASWEILGSVGSCGVIGQSQSVLAVFPFNGELVAAGQFCWQVGGAIITNLARWDGSQWLAVMGALGSIGYSNPYASNLAIYKGELVVGGAFGHLDGGLVYNIARWDGSRWGALGNGIFGQSGDAVHAWEPYNGGLVAGGEFEDAAGAHVRNIALWDGSTWRPLGGGISGPVYVMTIYDGDLIAGGEFDSAGDTMARNIARWDGMVWHPLGDGLDLRVFAMTVFDDRLIVGGEGRGLALWDGSTWQFSDTELVGGVYALMVYNGDLISGGEFSQVGKVPANCIAGWDGAIWYPIGSGMGGGHCDVLALATYDGKLIAGGTFDTAGDVSCNRIAEWDGHTWRRMGSGLSDFVGALAVYNGDLIAGGAFRTAGGSNAEHIARWDGSVWQPMESGVDHLVADLTVYGGELIVGGSFERAGETASLLWARWGPKALCGADGAIDLNDFAGFVDCVSGPREPSSAASTSSGCLCLFNIDGDGDVDLRDFASLQNGFGEPRNLWRDCDTATILNSTMSPPPTPQVVRTEIERSRARVQRRVKIP